MKNAKARNPAAVKLTENTARYPARREQNIGQEKKVRNNVRKTRITAKEASRNDSDRSTILRAAAQLDNRPYFAER